MTNEEVRRAVDALPLSQKEIAAQICCSHGHLRNVLANTTQIGGAVGALLQRLVADLGEGVKEAKE